MVVAWRPAQASFCRHLRAFEHARGESGSAVLFSRRGGERVYVRSEAALKVAAYLGGLWKVFLCAYVVPRPLRDYLYDLFARNRYRFFGKYDQCMLPPAEARARFIDV